MEGLLNEGWWSEVLQSNLKCSSFAGETNGFVFFTFSPQGEQNGSPLCEQARQMLMSQEQASQRSLVSLVVVGRKQGSRTVVNGGLFVCYLFIPTWLEIIHNGPCFVLCCVLLCPKTKTCVTTSAALHCPSALVSWHISFIHSLVFRGSKSSRAFSSSWWCFFQVLEETKHRAKRHKYYSFNITMTFIRVCYSFIMTASCSQVVTVCAESSPEQRYSSTTVTELHNGSTVKEKERFVHLD